MTTAIIGLGYVGLPVKQGHAATSEIEVNEIKDACHLKFTRRWGMKRILQSGVSDDMCTQSTERGSLMLIDDQARYHCPDAASGRVMSPSRSGLRKIVKSSGLSES